MSRFVVWFAVLLSVLGGQQSLARDEFVAPEDVHPEVAAAVRSYAETGVAKEILVGDHRRVPFGVEVPWIRCAPLRVCAVVLEAGEIVYGILAGDTARWHQFETVTGPGGDTPVLGFSPILERRRTCDVTTSVLVTTDRRIYRLILDVPPCKAQDRGENPQREFDSVVEFYYPAQMLRSWTARAQAQREEVVRARAAVEEKKAASQELDVTSLEALVFYSISGARRFGWKPSIFDDGRQTYVRLPAEAKESPVVFRAGGQDLEILNFRTHEGDPALLIVEGVHSELVLTLPGRRGKPRKLVARRRGGEDG